MLAIHRRIHSSHRLALLASAALTRPTLRTSFSSSSSSSPPPPPLLPPRRHLHITSAAAAAAATTTTGGDGNLLVQDILQRHIEPHVRQWSAVHGKPASQCRVVVAMSGGVDSAVCALLLRRSNLFGSVVGLYMHNWEVEDEWGGNTDRHGSGGRSGGGGGATQLGSLNYGSGSGGCSSSGSDSGSSSSSSSSGGSSSGHSNNNNSSNSNSSHRSMMRGNGSGTASPPPLQHHHHRHRHGETTSACPSGANWRDVEAVCGALDMECHRKEFVRDYWVRVFEPMLHMYERGDMTPNPDVWCNRHVKFDRMMHYARDTMGADLVVTGHYARLQIHTAQRHQHQQQGRVEEGGAFVRLLRGVDPLKDQSYFLSTVRQQSLRHAFFPLGGLHKKDAVKPLARLVPELAAVRDKRESMGVCFIGKRKMGDFLDEYIEPHAGDIVSHEGAVLGQHSGMHHYTIGQGAKIGGQREKWFVYEKDASTNTVRVCPGSDHPALFRSECIIDQCEWNYRDEYLDQTDAGEEEEDGRLLWWQSVVQDLGNMKLSAKVRYNQHEPVQCTVQPVADQVGRLRVSFSEPIRGITPGQVCVLYNHGEQCLGGGIVQQSFVNGGGAPLHRTNKIE